MKAWDIIVRCYHVELIDYILQNIFSEKNEKELLVSQSLIMASYPTMIRNRLHSWLNNASLFFIGFSSCSQIFFVNCWGVFSYSIFHASTSEALFSSEFLSVLHANFLVRVWLWKVSLLFIFSELFEDLRKFVIYVFTLWNSRFP